MKLWIKNLQRLIVQSADSPIFSAKPTTCSKVVGRKERSAVNNVYKITTVTRSPLGNAGAKKVQSAPRTSRRVTLTVAPGIKTK